MKILYWLIALFTLCRVSTGWGKDVEMSLDEKALVKLLDKEIANSDKYLRLKELKIDSLRKELNASMHDDYVRQYQLCYELLNQFKSFSYDSAMVYIACMEKIANRQSDSQKREEVRLEQVSLFIGGGLYPLATDTLLVINTKALNLPLKQKYYQLAARLNYDIAGYVSDQQYSPLLIEKANRYQDSLLALYEPHSDNYKTNLAKRYNYANQFERSIKVLVPLLEKWHLSMPEFPILASTLSFCYRSTGNMQETKRFLILALISDIRNVKKESTSAIHLAEIFYKEKNIDRAHQLVQLAQEDATFFNARQRKLRISKTLPLVETERMLKEQEKRSRIRFYAIVISLLALAITLFLIIIYQQLIKIRRSQKIIRETNRSLEEINARLKESNIIKDKYIADFLDLCSDYISKMDNQQKTVRRKLREKNQRELPGMLNDKLVEEERSLLFKRFDTIFLSLFPTFIRDFNALLDTHEEIIPRKNELLNTELRIYALIRLGINDANSISNFLNCSLNTIYTYKTKINSKVSTLDKQEFEKTIMQIGINTQ